MELRLTREMLRFERLVNRGEEQVTIEGEATLPGSMRDAVTVLSVQAQAHLSDTQAGRDEAGVRGRVCFQVLYTQGDLTRVRALETSCDFTHVLPLAGASPAMRIEAAAAVQETEGRAASGRMTLRALLSIQTEAFETVERELVTQAEGANAAEGESLQTRMQEVTFCLREMLGENKTLVREEFDLPAKLGVEDVLSATATATAGELSGGNGRIGVSGMIEVRALHRPGEAGSPMVMTTHELPYDLAIDVPQTAQMEDGAQMQAEAEVIDVMADSVENDRHRTLRVEAEVRVRLHICRKRQMQLLEDLYSTGSTALEPVREALDVLTGEERTEVRESTRLQVSLPKDMPPMGTVLCGFAQPTVTAVSPSGRRLDAEGVMDVTLLYLPVDSDIPVAMHTREPFMMTFPVEAEKDVRVQAYAIETGIGPTTSDRAELRCVLGLRARQHGVRRMEGVSDVNEREAEAQERGFVLVWPAEGESRWETARRLRVPETALHTAGKRALLAFRR